MPTGAFWCNAPGCEQPDSECTEHCAYAPCIAPPYRERLCSYHYKKARKRLLRMRLKGITDLMKRPFA